MPSTSNSGDPMSYSVPEHLAHMADALQSAFQDGCAAAQSAASWTTDGNGDPEAYAETLRMIENGDPMADERIPAMPNLSGEWADSPTPQSLASEHLTDDATDDERDALAEAWEAGVEATFMDAVEAELRTAIPTPDGITVPAMYVGQPDATLVVTDHGETYSMALHVSGSIVAQGDGFGAGALDFATTDDDEPARIGRTVGTFGSFLAHAIESTDDDARSGWSVLTDDASDWTDALAIMASDLEG